MKGSFLNFKLCAFDPVRSPDLMIGGSVLVVERGFNVMFQIFGPIEKINLPHPSPKPKRANKLWESTCFELFIKQRDSQEYWEVNVSPSGQWNVYHFKGYRDGQKKEKTIDSMMVIEGVREQDQYVLQFSLPVADILKVNDLSEVSLDIGVSAVIEMESGSKSYWALIHTNPEPDFHDSKQFLLKS